MVRFNDEIVFKTDYIKLDINNKVITEDFLFLENRDVWSKDKQAWCLDRNYEAYLMIKYLRMIRKIRDD